MFKLIALLTLCTYSLQAKWGEIKTIHRELSTSGWNEPWLSSYKHEDIAVLDLLKTLAKSPSGRNIIARSNKKARHLNKKLSELIHIGDHSITDTTLVRRFSAAKADEVKYESRSEVYINRSLSKKDALLDLAHELTHFSSREAFNPYQQSFGLKEFVQNTVEGKGGEVEAYLVECQVYFELFGHERRRNQKCHLVIDQESGKLSAFKGKQQFYRLGDHYPDFRTHVKKHDLSHQDFTAMSGEEAIFISSAYGLPYPLAAVLEYESIMTKVCDNDEKRLSYLVGKRSPASFDTYQSKVTEHKRRCAKFTQR